MFTAYYFLQHQLKRQSVCWFFSYTHTLDGILFFGAHVRPMLYAVSWILFPFLVKLYLAIGSLLISFVFFNGDKKLKCVAWNVSGINSQQQWDAIWQMIEETVCVFFSIQEIKRKNFDIRYIRQFTPKRFDAFDFIPSVGASGGILVVWGSSLSMGWSWINVALRSRCNSPKHKIYLPGKSP